MENKYKDFNLLVGDVKTHIRENPEAKIVENDDAKSLIVRYVDTITKDSWEISIVDLKRWSKTDTRGGDLILRAFQTQEGKEALLEIISKAR